MTKTIAARRDEFRRPSRRFDRKLAGVGLASNAQFLLRLFADHAGVPGRFPDKINSGIADTFQGKNPLPGIRSNHRSHATSRRSERHFHRYVIIPVSYTHLTLPTILRV